MAVIEVWCGPAGEATWTEAAPAPWRVRPVLDWTYARSLQRSLTDEQQETLREAVAVTTLEKLELRRREFRLPNGARATYV